MVVNLINDLSLARGSDLVINEQITIRQPTIDEIAEIGEVKYYSFCQNFTAHTLDENVIVYLDKLGIDFTTISDWELFVGLVSTYDQDIATLIFGNLDITTLQATNLEDGSLCLQNKDGVVITEDIYNQVVRNIRKMNNMPEPQFTRIMDDPIQKKMAIDTAKRNVQSAMNRARFYPMRSVLLPVVSSVIAYCHWTFDEVLNMKIFRFWEIVSRIQALDNATHLYTGLYSGCVSFKDNPSLKKDLDWMRALH